MLARHTGACRVDWVELLENLDGDFEWKCLKARALCFFFGLVLISAVLIF